MAEGAPERQSQADAILLPKPDSSRTDMGIRQEEVREQSGIRQCEATTDAIGLVCAAFETRHCEERRLPDSDRGASEFSGIACRITFAVGHISEMSSWIRIGSKYPSQQNI